MAPRLNLSYVLASKGHQEAGVMSLREVPLQVDEVTSPRRRNLCLGCGPRLRLVHQELDRPELVLLQTAHRLMVVNGFCRR